MNPWTTYCSRIVAQGTDKRGAAKQHEIDYLRRKIQGSLSYHHVLLDGVPKDVAIMNSDNLDTKTICSMPGASLPLGGIVEWMDSHWIITDKDYNTEIYTRCTMLQCNYELKWIADDLSIQKRWCYVEDGTKYLTGEYSDYQFVATRGDSRIGVTLTKDKYTVRLKRTNRFLIDDPNSTDIISYRLTKPLKLGGGYGDDGVYKFVMQECNLEDTDNVKLMIANYYEYFPEQSKLEEPNYSDWAIDEQESRKPKGDRNERKSWI